MSLCFLPGSSTGLRQCGREGGHTQLGATNDRRKGQVEKGLPPRRAPRGHGLWKGQGLAEVGPGPGPALQCWEGPWALPGVVTFLMPVGQVGVRLGLPSWAWEVELTPAGGELHTAAPEQDVDGAMCGGPNPFPGRCGSCLALVTCYTTQAGCPVGLMPQCAQLLAGALGAPLLADLRGRAPCL